MDIYRDPDACPGCGGPKKIYMGGGMWDDCPCTWDVFDEQGEAAADYDDCRVQIGGTCKCEDGKHGEPEGDACEPK